ncbi:hypothetical protein E2C01_015258 [Portunus trituberculatus]|uniref:Uncharacterized protein n=1 Tax=Portunus trituberculatus TaxID=210409 RepID=A0A5B7DLB6_PORTR|nr:hypothetical protein [Portunus trituberculatus]
MAVGRVVAAGALLLRLPVRAGPQVWWRPRLPVLPWAVVISPSGLLGSSHQALHGSLTLLADPEWPRRSSGCGSSSTPPDLGSSTPEFLCWFAFDLHVWSGEWKSVVEVRMSPPAYENDEVEAWRRVVIRGRWRGPTG